MKIQKVKLRISGDEVVSPEYSCPLDGRFQKEVELVVLTPAQYKELDKRDRKLRALEAGGVDNWEWYSDSLEDHYEDDEEEEEDDE